MESKAKMQHPGAFIRDNAIEDEDEQDDDQECPECFKPMLTFDEQLTEEHDGEAIDEAGSMFIEWKPGDITDAGPISVCVDCQLMTVKCRSCDKLMKFMGHMGYSDDGEQYRRSVGDDRPTLLPSNTPPPKDLSKPRMEFSDINKYKFKMKDWHPRGPLGDMPHFWRCENCEADFALGI